MIQEYSISPLLDNNLILLVDDVPNNLKVLSSLLAISGFEVAIATSGEGALQQLEYTSVSLVLLDVMMPGIDGFETCRRMKANPATQNIPIIFITALSEPVDKVQGFDLGAVDYVTKPFQKDEVLARVRTHLKLNQLSQTLELRNIELQQLAEQLEQRVIERTQELSTQKQNLEQALLELQQAHLQLVKSEKMSTLGNLLAGIAHEINNPIGFISGNLNEAQHSIDDLVKHLHMYSSSKSSPSDITIHAQEIDLEYLIEDLPKMIKSMKLGCDRIKNISTGLRTFSRTDSDLPVAFNLHEGIDSTISILKHRLKADSKHPEIQVIKNYGNLPLVECYAGQLNQVFMNILANAIDALDESSSRKSYTEIEQKPNSITITTSLEGNYVKVAIADNGMGMPEEVKQRIFDYLFTTKEVGKGTGLGLAITRQIIVEKHHGTIDVNSELGQGTEFIITLPTGI